MPIINNPSLNTNKPLPLEVLGKVSLLWIFANLNVCVTG